jgi:hypothetical protein
MKPQIWKLKPLYFREGMQFSGRALKCTKALRWISRIAKKKKKNKTLHLNNLCQKEKSQ